MQNDSGEPSWFSVILFVTIVLFLRYMNIKVNDVCRRAMNAFQKYLFSMKHIFPLLPFRTRLSLQKLEYFTSQSEKCNDLRWSCSNKHLAFKAGWNEWRNCNLQYHTRVITNIHRKQRICELCLMWLGATASSSYSNYYSSRTTESIGRKCEQGSRMKCTQFTYRRSPAYYLAQCVTKKYCYGITNRKTVSNRGGPG